MDGKAINQYGGKGLKRLAAFVSIMSDLKSFHINNMRTWEKFLTFEPKIVPNASHNSQKTHRIGTVLQSSLFNMSHYVKLHNQHQNSEYSEHSEYSENSENSEYSLMES